MRLKLFLLFLLIIGIIASFFLPSTLVKVSLALYGDSASPYNINWTGTSLLVSRLKSDEVDVVIVNSTSELSREIEKGGLVLIIAPDTPLSNDTVNILTGGFSRGLIDIAVFDENTTSNLLLSRFDLSIDGRSLLDPSMPDTPQYPVAKIASLNGSVYYIRLNWASIIRPVFNSSMKIFAVGIGILDLNDNGKIDENLPIQNYPIGVIYSHNNSTLLVFTDSYPLLNVALSKNYTSSRILYEYILHLAREKNNRVIIPNNIYQEKQISIMLPFHIGILFVLAANFLKWIDNLIDTMILGNEFLNTLFTLFIIISISLFLRFVFRVGTYGSYEASIIDEILYISEVPVSKALIFEKHVKGREKQLIAKYWEILALIYKNTLGVELDKVIGSDKEIEYLASRINTDVKILRKKLNKLYNTYLQAIGEKRALPFIRWRKRLLNYINEVDYLLNLIGYTITGKKGYRDVLYYIK